MKRYYYIIVLSLLFLNNIIAIETLKVVSVYPSSHSLYADKNVTIKIKFNSHVDSSSINDTTFMVYGRWTGVHKGTIELIDSNLFFTLNNNFNAGEQVTVSLSKGMSDISGATLGHGYAFSFWIRPNEGTLQLSQISIIPVRLPGESWIQTLLELMRIMLLMNFSFTRIIPILLILQLP